MNRMPTDGHEGRRRFAAGVLLLCPLLLCAGCQSTNRAAALNEPLDEQEMIGGIMGPTERRLRDAHWERRREQLTSAGVAYEGFEEFESAQALYDAEQYRAAETAFRRLARRRENQGKTIGTRIGEFFSSTRESDGTLFGQYGDPIHEDALFMTAESQYAQQRYAKAQDSYGALLEKYPSSRHLDEVTWRLFEIARYWLNVPKADGTDSEIKLVSHETGGQAEIAIEEVGGAAGWPLLPNIIDRTRPVFDTEGRAIQALETIWQHDATGPLADDALMLQATYAQRKGDFVEAARLYQLVREQYPDSSHFQDAFLLGSHVTLASYSGANYDGQSLAQARELKEIARTFPSLSAEQRERLEQELVALQRAEMEREWARVEFYLRKNQPASVAVHCNTILHKYPDTEYARRAWEVLQEQEAEFNGRGRLQLWPFTEDEEDDAPPSRSLAGPAVDPPPEDAAEQEAEPESRRWFPQFGNLLRPVERPPQLVEPPAETEEYEPGRVRL